jgi:outer membrane protein assembly factor BamB
VIPTRLFLTATLLSAPLARAADWPQFLGPTRNATYPTPADLAPAWPPGGPKVLWQFKLGTGWSGPVVASGKLIQFHRVADNEAVECLDAATGKPLWHGQYPTDYRDDFDFDNGPRSTPAIDGDRVYTFGAEGALSCWNLADGNRVWHVDTKDALKAGKGFFGMVCSPLVEGDAVILNVGGTAGNDKGAGIAAFDKATGKILWQATDHEAGYASPVAATIAGHRYVLSLTRAGLVALEPKTGQVRFDHPFRARSTASVNAATPLVIDDHIFITASYATGAALLQFDPHGPKQIWANDDSLSAHYATPVYHAGHLYGFRGRQEQRPALRCVELKTGTVKWSQDNFGAGTILLAGDDLLILHEKGELIRVAASPVGYKVKQRDQVIGADTRAHPALAAGLLYARDKNKLYCLDLRKN